ncbi:hypothetical protein Tco_1353971 [Tanacetum coccineum]
MHATTTPPFPAVAAAVVGRGWRRVGAAAVDPTKTHPNPPENPRSITSVGAVRRQTTIVVAVGRRCSHQLSHHVCRACRRVNHRGVSGAQPLDATAVAAAEPAVATTATTAAP